MTPYIFASIFFTTLILFLETSPPFASSSPVAATDSEVAASVKECNVNADGSATCDESSATKHKIKNEEDERSRVKDQGEDCVDVVNECVHWASAGECKANPNYMLKNCAKSCENCPIQMDASLVDILLKYGVEQEVEGMESRKTMKIIQKTVAYMEDDVFGPNPTENIPRETALKCLNREKRCAFWAAIGECDANKSFMVTNCAPSCQSCHLIDLDQRCPPLDPSILPALSPGDLNTMFEQIIATAPGNRTVDSAENSLGINEADDMTNYTVTILSRPSPFEEGNRIIDKNRDLEEDPWIVTFDNFITEEECAHLIELGYKYGYERSRDVGKRKFDGSYDGYLSSTRTSENAWCDNFEGCRSDSVVQRVYRRMERVTGIPADNSEDLQLLKYTEGQFYRPHHDYIPHQKDRQCGPRILTFFLYLSDVEEGGGTRFTDLEIIVKPKRGRALLWPSVLDSDPKSIDSRTIHEAQDVINGTKFAANAWIHTFDFIRAKENGCV